VEVLHRRVHSSLDFVDAVADASRTPMKKQTSATKKSQVLSLLETTSGDAERRIAKLLKQLDEFDDEVQELPALDETSRSTSIGKLRDKEDDTILVLCDIMDAFPHYFASIAAKDRGSDDSRVETQPTRDAIALRKVLKELADKLSDLTGRLNDAVLVLGGQIRSVSIPAYRVAQTNAENDSKLQSKMVKVTSFYGESAKKAQATRKKNKQANED
jgi:hypothetical protein